MTEKSIMTNLTKFFSIV